jgi:16S rRNA processing protein RimM
MRPTSWVGLAHIVRPQGRNGEVIADILTDFPEKFAERRRVFLAAEGSGGQSSPREITLEKFRLHQQRVVLKFAGIGSIEDAETLRGLDVVIPAEERAALDEDSAYISDLMGCAVIDTSLPAEPRRLGVIVDVDRGATSTDLLVVQPDDEEAGLVEIPFVKAFLVKLDVANRRIEMRIPSGLLELNLPPKHATRAKGAKPR